MCLLLCRSSIVRNTRWRKFGHCPKKPNIFDRRKQCNGVPPTQTANIVKNKYIKTAGVQIMVIKSLLNYILRVIVINVAVMYYN